MIPNTVSCWINFDCSLASSILSLIGDRGLFLAWVGGENNLVKSQRSLHSIGAYIQIRTYIQVPVVACNTTSTCTFYGSCAEDKLPSCRAPPCQLFNSINLYRSILLIHYCTLQQKTQETRGVVCPQRTDINKR